ncbi:MAG TPA: S41 family peptidase [Fimbriimonadaceae bacterium]|nr:S41 family peptidase [Fimbriimonadaceae bacterium]
MLTTLIAAAAICGLQQQSASISDAQKQQTVEALLDELDKSYVFPDLAKKADDKVRKILTGGGYKEVTDPAAFASRLAKDVNDVLHDAHFRIHYSAENLPVREDNEEPSQAEIDAQRLMIKRLNGGIEKVERLPGNIGYLEVRSFLAGQDISRPAAAAFEFLKDTDALILDLSRNGGGDPEAVCILCSYFFGEEPVHLNDIYSRPRDKTQEFWTLKDLPAPRYNGKPVYVLTTKSTGSGAEECAYDLQTQGRATIVGGVTWGGANPGGTVRLNDHFSAFIPTGRAINPITKTNWEGTGVIPDVEAAPGDALAAAQVLALKKIIATTDDEQWAAMLKQRIEELQKGGS